MKLHLPVTGQTYKQVRRFVDGVLERSRASSEGPLLIFEFFIAPNQAEYGRGSEFGAAYQLADYLSSEALGRATTVAFIPRSVEGHAVLVALACDEIIMSREAEIGAAGIDETNITPTIALTYRDIAARQKDVPAEVAMALVDPSREVLVAETDFGTEYVSRQALEELAARQTVQPNPRVLVRGGQPARFSGVEARQNGFVNYLADDLMGVARAMDVPPQAIRQDPSLGGEWRAARVEIKGPVTAAAVDSAQRMIEEAVGKRGVNFVCLWIDSSGGSPADSLRLATYLASDLDPSEVRTVAYVPQKARADAALIALGCDQLVMHPEAVLGGEGDYIFSEPEITSIRTTFRKLIAPAKMRPWSLSVALVDAKTEVFRWTRFDDAKYSQYYSAEELAEQPNAEQWKRGARITTPGRPLELTGAQAHDYWLADSLADDFDQFKRSYGLERDPALLEPGWAEFLIDALASPSLAVALLVIGFAALYLELQIPGVGLGGFVAAVCFLLFFWSRFLGGTAGWLEATLFLAGVVSLALEIFILPGFGIFGLGGGLMVIASLVLASQTFIVPGNAYQFEQLRNSLLVLVGAGVGVVAAAVTMNRWLPKAALPEPPPAGLSESLVEYDHLLGVRGTAATSLVPSGKARLEGQLFDVVADGEYIDRHSEVEVIDVQGNRIVVRSLPAGGSA